MAKENLGALKVGLKFDSSELKSSLSTISTQMGILDSEIKAGTSGFTTMGKTADALKTQIAGLTDKISLQKDKVALLKSAYEDSVATKGKDDKATQKLQIQYNNATTSLNKMEEQLNVTNKELKNSATYTTELDTKVKNFGKNAGSVGTKMTIGLTAPIIALGTAITKSAMSFEDSFAKILTLLDESTTNFNEYKDAVLEASSESGIAINDFSEAVYESISSGVDANDAIEFTTKATKLATAGFSDTETAVDGLTTIMNTYGLKLDDIDELSNQLVITQNLGKTTVDELAGSIGDVIPLSATLKVKTSELFSAYASLTANGIKTTTATTSLKAAFSNIIKPSEQAKEMAKKLGIQFDSTSLQSLGLTGFLNMVKNATGGNVDSMAQLFGSTEAVNTILSLTSENGMTLYNQSLQEMTANTTATDDAYAKVTDTVQFKFDKSLNDLKNTGIDLGANLLPIVTDITSGISGLADWFGKLDENQQKTLLTVLGAVAIGGPLLVGIGNLVTAITTIKVALTAANIPLLLTVGGFAALGVGILAVAGNWGKMNGFERTISVLGLLAIAATTAAVAVGALQSAWSLGVAAVAITAGVVAITASIKSATKRAKSEVDGSHKLGLDYVPFDGYKAELHKGERVLTADENQSYNNLLNSVNSTKGIAHSINSTKNISNSTNNNLTVIVENFDNSRGQDVKQFAEELEFYRRKLAMAKGGNA